MSTTVLRPTTPRRGALTTLGATAAVVATAAAVPGITRYGPPCPLHTMTGLHCPGCGATRAVLALTRGDLAAAVGHNAFVVASLPLLAAIWIVWYQASRRDRAWPPLLRSSVPLVAWAAVGIAFAVARNLPVPLLEPLRP